MGILDVLAAPFNALTDVYQNAQWGQGWQQRAQQEADDRQRGIDRQSIMDKLNQAKEQQAIEEGKQKLLSTVAGNAAASATPHMVPDFSGGPVPNPPMKKQGYDISDDSLTGLPEAQRPQGRQIALNQKANADTAADLVQQKEDEAEKKNAAEIAWRQEQTRHMNTMEALQQRLLAERARKTGAEADKAAKPPDPNKGLVKVADPEDPTRTIFGHPKAGDVAPMSATVADRTEFNRTVSDQASKVLAGLNDKEIKDAMGPFAGKATRFALDNPTAAAVAGIHVSPKVRQFATDLASLKLTLSHAHYFKGSQGMVEHANQVTGDLNQDPNNLAAAVGGFKSFMDLSNKDRGVPPAVADAPQVGERRQFTGGRIGEWDGQGWKPVAP